MIATNTKTNYLLEDQQDSVSSILNADGSTLVNENFTAYGHRRNPTTWSGSASSDDLSVSAGVTRQGYTWQTALGNMGLNHMNGRVQDAITGVLLSPDPYISEPGNPQNYNRYSYVYNNPMSHTDPSGYSAVCLSNLCDGFYFAGGTGSGEWGSNNGYIDFGGTDTSLCYLSVCQKTQTGRSDYYWWEFDAYADTNTNKIVKVTARLITIHHLPNSILPSSNRSILEQAVGTATTSSSSSSVVARNTKLVPQTKKDDKTPCDQTPSASADKSNHLSSGVAVSGSTVNPVTSDGGGVWGRNWQSVPGGTSTFNTYNYSGKGVGLDVGVSAQSVWAWGRGSWTGEFRSINISLGPISGSVFWTPGEGGYTGISFGLGVGLPVPQGAYEVTNYSCKKP